MQETRHWMKYCPINEKMMRSAICKEEDHDTSDCEYAKKLMLQNKQQTFGNKITCQICEAITYTAAYCPDRKTSSRKRIQCAYCKRNGHNIDNCRKLKTLIIQSDTRKNHCDICKNPDHTTEECEIYKQYSNINTNSHNTTPQKKQLTNQKFRKLKLIQRILKGTMITN